MHMADALVSAAVGGGMLAVSAASVGYSAVKFKNDEQAEKKIPLTAVTGAFVFAAQMINIAIPGTGSSGHIGGGILLAAVLGGPAALLAVTAVLIIQCLFFADGGLLALGCNIFNIGVVPCLICYPLIFKPLYNYGKNGRYLNAASIVSCVAALQLGAFCVVLQTFFSGVSELPFGTFAALMQPIHLAIGLMEGLVTAAVLRFVYAARPDILDVGEGGPLSIKKTVIVVAAAAVMTGALFSVFASKKPDGLEWAAKKTAGREMELTNLLEDAAPMPDYEFKTANDTGAAAGTSAAGLIGGVLTFALAGGAGFLISAVKKTGKRAGVD